MKTATSTKASSTNQNTTVHSSLKQGTLKPSNLKTATVPLVNALSKTQAQPTQNDDSSFLSQSKSKSQIGIYQLPSNLSLSGKQSQDYNV